MVVVVVMVSRRQREGKIPSASQEDCSAKLAESAVQATESEPAARSDRGLCETVEGAWVRRARVGASSRLRLTRKVERLLLKVECWAAGLIKSSRLLGPHSLLGFGVVVSTRWLATEAGRDRGRGIS